MNTQDKNQGRKTQDESQDGRKVQVGQDTDRDRKQAGSRSQGQDDLNRKSH